MRANKGGRRRTLDVEARHQCVDACAAGQRHVAAKPLRLPGRGEQSSDAVAADLHDHRAGSRMDTSLHVAQHMKMSVTLGVVEKQAPTRVGCPHLTGDVG